MGEVKRELKGRTTRSNNSRTNQRVRVMSSSHSRRSAVRKATASKIPICTALEFGAFLRRSVSSCRSSDALWYAVPRSFLVPRRRL